jgi:hypothetical protein
MANQNMTPKPIHKGTAHVFGWEPGNGTFYHLQLSVFPEWDRFSLVWLNGGNGGQAATFAMGASFLALHYFQEKFSCGVGDAAAILAFLANFGLVGEIEFPPGFGKDGLRLPAESA